ncbi:MAG: glycosyltransferase [Deltaproteobacteria bacterium]|nr:glycosyltransferase [Deltaproteobacteria bacterium]
MTTATIKQPSISVVTATYNSAGFIADCMKSVMSQSISVEHIIIDGASTDDTLKIVRQISDSALIYSEPDRGIYDAMNKGILHAKGDVLGILNSDDFYVGPSVLKKVISLFQMSGADAVFADLVYVRPYNVDQVVRYYSGAGFSPDRFAWGWMPPHPTFFVRREVYEKYGLFDTHYKIAADYELAVRFLARYGIKYAYLPDVIVKMRTGGISTRNLKSNWILNREIIRACAENGIRTNLFKVYSKYFRKIMQLIERPQ